MRVVRLACFVTAAVLGAVTIVWAQTEAGGFVEACKYWSSTITVIGGAVLLIGGAAFAWSEVRNRLSNVEQDNKEFRESVDARFKRHSARLSGLELKRDRQHSELLEHLERIESAQGRD